MSPTGTSGSGTSWGYLPNYAPAFATRPDVAEAWNTLNNAVRGHMERRRFELATIAAARAYRSTYCMAAHCKFLRDDCGDESTMRAVAADPSGADLDATDRAVMDFATQVARDASSITAADVQQLRDHGLSDLIINMVSTPPTSHQGTRHAPIPTNHSTTLTHHIP